MFHTFEFGVKISLLVIVTFSIASEISYLEKRHFIQTNSTYEKSFSNLVPSSVVIRKNPNLKYILQWTSADHVPFLFMGVGQQGFIDRNCSYTNCYVTSFKHLLGDYTDFDVVAFYGPDVRQFTKYMLPERRSPHQKYVFASTESSDNFPLFLKRFDGYFNWTWTYKLDSDLRWGYVIVRDVEGNIIGPKENMDWIDKDDMLPVKRELRKILREKKKAVAWFASVCDTPSNREGEVRNLQEALNSKYGLDIDIYGDCGNFHCYEGDEEDCYETIRSDYYFYLAYEQSISDDFVTEELLRAVKYNAIPIVYGGADYSRFLPDGSYLDATQLDSEELADTIFELIHSPAEYEEYFKWTNHYAYSSTLDNEDSNEYCRMCALLSDEEKVKKVSVHKKLRNWWNPDKYRSVYENETFNSIIATKSTTTTSAVTIKISENAMKIHEPTMKISEVTTESTEPKTEHTKRSLSVIETIFDFSETGEKRNPKIGDVTRFAQLRALFPFMKSLF